MQQPWERERRIGIEVIKQAGGLGLTGIEVPTEHGGLGFSFSCKIKIFEILAGADFGFSLSLVNSHNVAKKLAHEAPQTLISEHVPAILSASKMGCTVLTEPGTGSDLASIQTTRPKNRIFDDLKEGRPG